MIPLTCEKIVRLFIALVVQRIHDTAHRLELSHWRRRFQARSRAGPPLPSSRLLRLSALDHVSMQSRGATTPRQGNERVSHTTSPLSSVDT